MSGHGMGYLVWLLSMYDSKREIENERWRGRGGGIELVDKKSWWMGRCYER